MEVTIDPSTSLQTQQLTVRAPIESLNSLKGTREVGKIEICGYVERVYDEIRVVLFNNKQYS
jgi:hypothetical protein